MMNVSGSYCEIQTLDLPEITNEDIAGHKSLTSILVVLCYVLIISFVAFNKLICSILSNSTVYTCTSKWKQLHVYGRNKDMYTVLFIQLIYIDTKLCLY